MKVLIPVAMSVVLSLATTLFAVVASRAITRSTFRARRAGGAAADAAPAI
jgi:hypothetical protein